MRLFSWTSKTPESATKMASARVATFATLCLSLLSPLTYAEGPDPAQLEAYFAQVQDTLELDAEQTEAIKPIVAAGREEQRAILASYGIDLQDPQNRPDISRRQARSMQKELKAAHKSMMSELETVLTKDQMKAFTKMQEAQREERRAAIRERVRGR